MFEGRDVIDRALPHIGERYVFGAHAILDNPDFKGPWDCAEFATWCVYQTYKTLIGVTYYGSPPRPDPYSGAWYDDMRTSGTLISVSEAAHTPGAVLLRLSTANNRIGHVAFSRGDGTTIEARGSRYGVGSWDIFAPGRVWHHGALIPGIAYTNGPEVVEPALETVLLQLKNPYMRGPEIEELQKALRRRSYHPGAVDGVFGPQTENAVINYQLVTGLTPDGIVGPETATALKISL